MSAQVDAWTQTSVNWNQPELDVFMTGMQLPLDVAPRPATLTSYSYALNSAALRWLAAATAGSKSSALDEAMTAEAQPAAVCVVAPADGTVPAVEGVRGVEGVEGVEGVAGVDGVLGVLPWCVVPVVRGVPVLGVLDGIGVWVPRYWFAAAFALVAAAKRASAPSTRRCCVCAPLEATRNAAMPTASTALSSQTTRIGGPGRPLCELAIASTSSGSSDLAILFSTSVPLSPGSEWLSAGTRSRAEDYDFPVRFCTEPHAISGLNARLQRYPLLNDAVF
jgi:hypothetical protein